MKENDRKLLETSLEVAAEVILPSIKLGGNILMIVGALSTVILACIYSTKIIAGTEMAQKILERFSPFFQNIK